MHKSFVMAATLLSITFVQPVLTHAYARDNATSNSTSAPFNSKAYKRYFILGAIVSGENMPAVGSKVIWKHGTPELIENNETHKFKLEFRNFDQRFDNLVRANNKYILNISNGAAKKILVTLKNPAGCKRGWQEDTCYSQKLMAHSGKTTIWLITQAHYYVTVNKVNGKEIRMHIDAIRFNGNGSYMYVLPHVLTHVVGR